jgi:pimeloyl-ACP methyl ester carboxylesterase
LIFGAGVLVIAMVSGLLFEQTQRARDRKRYPQIGRPIDIGGRMLDIDCAGTGQPAVILESGANWAVNSAVHDPRTIFANGGPRPGYGWVSIQRALATLTTVCWYDRAGSGWSDLGPYPRDSASQARDLRALLRAAQLLPPYVLVGESSAALDTRVYTGFYPSDVAGLVLINWGDPALFLDPRTNNGKRAKQIPQLIYQSQDAMAQLFNLVGVYRLGPVPPAPAPPKGLTVAEWNTIWFLTHSSKAVSALMQDIASWRLSSAEAGSRQPRRPSAGGSPCWEPLRAARIHRGVDERAERSRPTVHARTTDRGWRGCQRPPVRCAKCHRRGCPPGRRRCTQAQSINLRPLVINLVRASTKATHAAGTARFPCACFAAVGSTGFRQRQQHGDFGK